MNSFTEDCEYFDDFSDSDNDSNTGDSHNEKAAKFCRLPQKELSDEEKIAFPFLLNTENLIVDSYIITRNYACLMWTQDCKTQVTVDRLVSFLMTTLSYEHLAVMYQAGLTKPITKNMLLNQDEVFDVLTLQVKIKLAINPPYNWNPWGSANAKSNLNDLSYLTVLFLERYGYINYGVFKILNEPLTVGRIESTISEKKNSNRSGSPDKPRPLNILIIGAGISGLTAAKQLAYFGCNVTILESRDKPGGRLRTYKTNDTTSDLGAMVVTGLSSNPVRILVDQLNLELIPLNTDCNIYNPNGSLVNRNMDEFVEDEFNKLLATAAHACHARQIDVHHNEQLSLGRVLEGLIKYQEKKFANLKVTHRELEDRILERRKKLHKLILESKQEVEKCYSEYHSKLSEAWREAQKKLHGSEIDLTNEETEEINIEQAILNFDSETEYQLRLLMANHYSVWKKYEPLENAHNRLKRQLEMLSQNQPRDEYLSKEELQLLNWHFANLEYANSTSLNNLSLRHWDQDDMFEMAGDHCCIKSGFASLAEKMASSLEDNDKNLGVKSKNMMNPNLSSNWKQHKVPIHYKTLTKVVEYNETGVKVQAFNSVLSENEPISYTADAILCTLPLGILKNSINLPSTTSNKTKDIKENSVSFKPPLPKPKVSSIMKLGNGVLNKVILKFQKPFWDKSQNLFGYVNPESKKRGELFLFWHTPTDPSALVALVCGQAALDLEKDKDTIITRNNSLANLSTKGLESQKLQVNLENLSNKGSFNSGKSALNEPIVKKAVEILRMIFATNNKTDPTKKVPDPLDAVVTRWESDVHSKGSYSYVAVEASGEDYDIIGQPVAYHKDNSSHLVPTKIIKNVIENAIDDENEELVEKAAEDEKEESSSTLSLAPIFKTTSLAPKIFFAGEHTCRNYPATVHGAIFSGLREASRISNAYFPGELPITSWRFKIEN